MVVVHVSYRERKDLVNKVHKLRTVEGKDGLTFGGLPSWEQRTEINIEIKMTSRIVCRLFVTYKLFIQFITN